MSTASPILARAETARHVLDIVWTAHVQLGDNRGSSTERHARDFRPGDGRGQAGAAARTLYAAAMAGCPQSTAPITAINSVQHLHVGKAPL